MSVERREKQPADAFFGGWRVEKMGKTAVPLFPIFSKVNPSSLFSP
jgi:hypothetical protein